MLIVSISHVPLCYSIYLTVDTDKNGVGKEYRRLSPLEAAGVYTEALDRRFEKMEKGAREKMLEAMRWEDSNLRKHIEKHRLEQWAKETRKTAEEAVDQQYDAATVEGASKSPTKPKALTASGEENGTL